jgi:hypothetical protein
MKNGFLAQVPDELLASNTEIQLPTWDECSDLIAHDLPALTSPPSLPPDVLVARKEHVNSDICSFLHAPHDQNSPSKDISHLKGIGLYTHVGLPPQEPTFPHQHSSTSPPQFLPLGGYGRTKQKPMKGNPHIPEPVKAAYETLKEVMIEEEKLGGTAVSPQTRFHGLSLPEKNVTSATTTSEMENTEINGMDEDTVMVDESDEPRRHSIAGVVPQSWDNSRRTSVPGGNTRPVAVPARGMTTSGTTYDKSRDPRRRGR